MLAQQAKMDDANNDVMDQMHKLNGSFRKLWSKLTVTEQVNSVLFKKLVSTEHLFWTRLWHKKNKGVRQSHASSRYSEAIDVWKVARHPPSRRVVACDDYSFKKTIVFFLLQWDVWTIIKLKLKQASKESQKEFHRKKIRERLAKMFFTFMSHFHKVREDLKRL